MNLIPNMVNKIDENGAVSFLCVTFQLQYCVMIYNC